MRILSFAAGLLLLFSVPGLAQTRIDSINTNFRWLGPDDKIVVERYDDPRVDGVSCYLSRATTGGIKGGLGLAETRAGSRSLAGRWGRSRCRPRCRAAR
jgi:CreA protein